MHPLTDFEENPLRGLGVVCAQCFAGRNVGWKRGGTEEREKFRPAACLPALSSIATAHPSFEKDSIDRFFLSTRSALIAKPRLYFDARSAAES